ncbi:hypothetical protein M404DRAFT_28144 [Pisolithus tinctorius Marx 270]|uniref:Uncharacterized protein n=1 Tax=Pisolithus tinctorius Marx 270 TaxID=870435 RepID=A0A0C3NMY1_PISTI|nr:hypothetical protein M404DRAFT_28144 [Pisolithus tinctorius Marx 270]
MADIPCLACGKIVWGDRGLSMHTKQWCPNKESADDKMLREYRERMATQQAESERLQCLQEEAEATRRHEEEEREAQHAQRLAEFADLGFDGPDLGEDIERRPSGLPKRHRRLPQHYRDKLPVAPVPAPVINDLQDGPPYDADAMDTVENQPGESPLSPIYHTDPNGYGMFREYEGGFPTYDPESSIHMEQLCDSHNLE